MGGQVFLPGEQQVADAVHRACVPEARRQMGLPSGLPGGLEVVVEAADAANPEGVVQHQAQGGGGVPLPAVGGEDHDAHVPPVFVRRVVEVDIADPLPVRPAPDVGVEPLRLPAYPLGVPRLPLLPGEVNAARVLVVARPGVIAYIVGHGGGVGHHLLVKPEVVELGDIQVKFHAQPSA